MTLASWAGVRDHFLDFNILLEEICVKLLFSICIILLCYSS